jgi:uncharacterized protein
MADKVDSAAVQDGYQLYHHAFLFSKAGNWCVVQQGMSDESGTGRRYHWLSVSVTSFVNEPHEATCSEKTAATLNLVAAEQDTPPATSVEPSGSPDRVLKVVRRGLPFDICRRSICRDGMRWDCRTSIRITFGPC